ncbi:MAG: FAD-dependent oxidoreductase [Bacteroidaceae bacterium]|nr:FAD-dependent oxidoreductase [Bacteroidaceae bacterium]
MKRTSLIKIIGLLSVLTAAIPARAASLLVETESFSHKGGWMLDQQFMDEMGSPYLLAHGMGIPVEDATAEIQLPQTGTYYIYVRTFNWTSPWHPGSGPGVFQLLFNGKKTTTKPLGAEGDQWTWQPAGKVKATKPTATIALHDLSGFDGRCDAIYFTTEPDDMPPSDVFSLTDWRRQMLHHPANPQQAGNFDLVICGAGTAGICAAVSAARLGLKVALINDRPVLGGNNSSEVRVHMGGRINAGPYPRLGDLQKEFNPSRGGNAQPADYYEDNKKMEFIGSEPNIKLFLNFHVNGVVKKDGRIQAVIAQHIENGVRISFAAPIFCDCTGDGTVGYLSGADYRMGREGRAEFNESRAPEQADSMTLGASVMWYSVPEEKASNFPEFTYGMHFNAQNCERVTMGEWTWETGMNIDKTKHLERVRDYGMLVIYANWSYLKNHLPDSLGYDKRRLGWVSFMAGKRESRRLLGDYILKQDDMTRYILHEDGTAAATWTIDLHYPDPANTENFPGAEFKAKTEHTSIYPYPIPYRCLYSRNVDNLFMAGRCISVTHVAHGSIRVMRTTGMMGEVVGMAASLCRRYDCLPRAVYQNHLPELKALMKQGIGRPDVVNDQGYNAGGGLSEPPRVK